MEKIEIREIEEDDIEKGFLDSLDFLRKASDYEKNDPYEILKNSLAYFKNKHSNLTADVEVEPKMRAMNARERAQKIESDVHSKELSHVTKEVDDLTNEIIASNELRVITEVNEIKTKFNEDTKKTNLIKKALQGTINCLLGKR